MSLLPILRYPDPAVKSLDTRFDEIKIGSAAVERLWTGGRWTEGPAWFGDLRCLVFSDIPNNRMLRWSEETNSVDVFRAPCNNANGNTRDRAGRLITCEHDARRVTRTNHDGSISVLADGFDGKPFNAPNDVVVHSDGSIWFTDPGYGTLSDYEGHKAKHELPTAVYRISADGRKLTKVADDFERPNGLCFSPDERKLYVVDSGSPKTISMLDVRAGKLANKRKFADMKPGSADGIRCDAAGNVWAATCFGGEGWDGVNVFAPGGSHIGQINLPEGCANLCFGGVKKNRLFMTASQSLYSVYVNAKGI